MKTVTVDDPTSPSVAVEPSFWRRFAPALTHRNYRLFLAGQGVSLIGTWMQQLGVSWLTYQLTGSAWLLGLVNFSGQLPALFLTVPAGVFADRWNRYRALFVMQTLAMIQSLALVWVVWRGNVQIWEMIVLSVINGVLNALEMPSRQSFLTEMVPDRHDLANAVALNSSMVNSARLVGPFLAGVLIAVGGVIACFIGNAISFIAVLVALAFMRDLPPSRPHHTGPLLKGLVEGVRYAWGFTPIRRLLMAATLASFTGASLALLLPIYADKILGGGPGLLGSLTGASGIGALCAALYLLARRSVLGLGRWLVGTASAFGVALLGFAWSGNVPLSLGLLVVTGFSMMFQMATCNTLLQTIVEEDKRGRVMSLYSLAFLGTAPLASLAAGLAGEELGPAVTLSLCGAASVAGAVLFAYGLPELRRLIRPIYVHHGILPPDENPRQQVPPIVAAVESTAELTVPAEKAG
jgi:MFS family permease